MSQDFKFKFDRMRENDPTGSTDENGGVQSGTDKYETVGHSRNIGFVLLDGRRVFLNYSYLVSAEYSPVANSITLDFTTHTVVLNGIMLQQLYHELMGHIPRVISCVEARYNNVLERDQYAVNEITIEKNG